MKYVGRRKRGEIKGTHGGGTEENKARYKNKKIGANS